MDRRAWQAALHGVAKSHKEIENQRNISSFMFLRAKVTKRYKPREIKNCFPLWWELSLLSTTFIYNIQHCWLYLPCCTYIPSTYFSYNCNVVPFDYLHYTPLPPASSNHNLISFSMSLFLKCKWAICIFFVHSTYTLQRTYLVQK